MQTNSSRTSRSASGFKFSPSRSPIPNRWTKPTTANNKRSPRSTPRSVGWVEARNPTIPVFENRSIIYTPMEVYISSYSMALPLDYAIDIDAVGFRFSLLGALPWSGDPTGAHPLPNLRISLARSIRNQIIDKRILCKHLIAGPRECILERKSRNLIDDANF